MRRMRESDLRDDGAGPSRITGDGSAGVSRKRQDVPVSSPRNFLMKA